MKKLLFVLFILLGSQAAKAEEQYFHEFYITVNDSIVAFVQGFSSREEIPEEEMIHWDVLIEPYVKFEINLNTRQSRLVACLWGFDGFKHDGVWEIPDHVDYKGVSYPLTEVYGFSQCQLTKIVIPNTVTVVGDMGASSCPKLESVVLGNSVKTILPYAFRNCPFDFDIPSSVEVIGKCAFCNTGITSLNLGKSVKSIGPEAFADCDSLETVNWDCALDSIPYECFYVCKNLQTVTLGEGLKAIGSSAFEYCISLKKIVIPDGVRAIRASAFSQCESLEDIRLPQSLESIGDYAFGKRHNSNERKCISLKHIDLPEGLDSIGKYAFQWSGLEDLVLPEGLVFLGNDAFAFTNIKTLVVPQSLKEIPERCFYWCKELSEPDLGTVETFGSEAFAECKNLQTVKLSGKDIKLLGHAFAAGSPISLILAEGVESFEVRGFQFGGKLYFPSTIKRCVSKETYDSYFAGGLSDVYCKSFFNLADDFFDTFKNENEITLHVPHDLMQQFYDSSPWNKLKYLVDIETGEPFIPKKCAKPEISFNNRQLSFTCDTEGVVFVTAIASSDAGISYAQTIQLTGVYTVTTYARRNKYDDSEKAYATICLLEGEQEIPGNVQFSETGHAVLIKSHEGMITIQGVSAGDDIQVCDIAGRLLASCRAGGDTVNVFTPLKKGDTAIIRIAGKTVKVILTD